MKYTNCKIARCSIIMYYQYYRDLKHHVEMVCDVKTRILFTWQQNYMYPLEDNAHCPGRLQQRSAQAKILEFYPAQPKKHTA